MANNLIEYEDSTQSGKTVYAVARNASGQWANGTTFENYNAAHWTSYAIVLTETGSTGYFTAATPALAAGTYAVGIRSQAGGSPATTDPSKGGFTAYWDGTAWHVGPVNVDAIGGTAQTARDLGNALPASAPGTANGLPVLDGGHLIVGGYASGQDPATLVLDVAGSGHNVAGTIGHAINSAGSATDPFAVDLFTGSYTGSQAGAIFVDMASYIAGDLDESTPGVTLIKKWKTPATTQATVKTTPVTRIRQ